MKKLKQRNWLIIITSFLFISSTIVFIVTTKRELGLGNCEYDGIEYESGEIIPNYEGRSNCYCSWNGEILCDNSELSVSYSNFSSSGISFSYLFKSFLEKESPDQTRITLVDINQQGSKLDIVIEREALCSEDGSAPVQLGLYERKENSLVLTNITNTDETLYSRSCVISNTFSFPEFLLTGKKSYSILYQNQIGQLYDLNVCFFKERIYAPGDVFKDSLSNSLCTCNGPETSCEKL